jgi:hypothetical protein
MFRIPIGPQLAAKCFRSRSTDSHPWSLNNSSITPHLQAHAILGVCPGALQANLAAITCVNPMAMLDAEGVLPKDNGPQPKLEPSPVPPATGGYFSELLMVV